MGWKVVRRQLQGHQDQVHEAGDADTSGHHRAVFLQDLGGLGDQHTKGRECNSSADWRQQAEGGGRACIQTRRALCLPEHPQWLHSEVSQAAWNQVLPHWVRSDLVPDQSQGRRCWTQVDILSSKPGGLGPQLYQVGCRKPRNRPNFEVADPVLNGQPVCQGDNLLGRHRQSFATLRK